MRKGIFLGLLVLWSLTLAVVPVGAEEVVSGAEAGTVTDSAVLDKGVELFRSGELDEALSVFRGFIVQSYDSPQLPRAYLFMARIFLERGQYSEAITYIERLPDESWGPEARFIKGVALVELERVDEGMELLLSLQEAPLFPEDHLKLLLSLAKGHTLQGQPLQALLFYHRALGEGGKRDSVLALAHGIFEKEMSEEQLQESVFMFQGTPLGLDAKMQLAWRAVGHGRVEEARTLVESVLADPTPFPYRKDAAVLLDRLSGGSWVQRNAIGVVLPLSGRYSAFGNLARRGIELASTLHNRANNPVNFVFKDSAADAERGAQAVAELANAERVMAIIGPLSGTASMAASNKAQSEGLPLITLSHREGLPELGDFIFRNSLTGRLQVRSLAQYAIQELGLKAFGVLAPRTPSGQELTAMFSEEVLALGGLVVEVESYPEEAVDFGPQIKAFLGSDPDLEKEEEAVEPQPEGEEAQGVEEQKEPEWPPVTFEALFIPEDGERVGLIAPQLAYFGLEKVQLLGTSTWNSPELLRRAGAFVEGAVMVDGFFRYSKYPFVQEFVDLYLETYREEPTILEAQAFDAAGILLSLLSRPEIQTRLDLQEALSQLKNYPGVTGATSFTPTGEVEKILFLLQVQKGNIVQIN